MRGKKHWGVEWGASGVRFACLERSGRGWFLAKAEKLDWPAFAPQTTWASAGKPADQWVNTLEIDPVARAPQLKAFVEVQKLRGQVVYLCIPRSEVFLKWVTLPSRDPEALKEIAAQEFPYSPSRLAWGLLAENSEGAERQVLLAGMPKERADRYKTAMEAAGLLWGGLGLNFLAHLTALKTFGGYFSSPESEALLDVGATDTQLTVVRNGWPLLCRSIPIGGTDLARRVQRRRSEGAGGPLSLKEEETRWRRELLEEIHKCRRYLHKTGRSRDFKNVFLIGGAAHEIGLGDELGPELGAEVKRVSFETDARYLGAYGQALSAAAGREGLWLLKGTPPARARGRVVAALFFLALGAGFFVHNALDRQEKNIEATLRGLEVRRLEKGSWASTGRGEPAVESFLEIALRMPAGSHLLQFRYDGPEGKISLRGRSANYAQVSELVSALSRSSILRPARGAQSNLVQVGERSVVEYSLELDLVNGSPVVNSWTGPDAPLEGVEERLAQIAGRSSVKRLSGLRLLAGGAFKEVHLDWDGDIRSSLRFLAESRKRGPLGPCLKLEVEGGEMDSALLRGRGVFYLQKAAGEKNARGAKSLPEIKLSRDVFRPLWVSRPQEARAERNQRKEEEARRREREEAERLNRERQEAERFEAKKRQLETQLVLTGIVDSGRERLAFVDSRGGTRRTLMLRQGDMVEEARVVSIDEKGGAVQLDYAGRFQVVLRLNNSGSGSTLP